MVDITEPEQELAPPLGTAVLRPGRPADPVAGGEGAGVEEPPQVAGTGGDDGELAASPESDEPAEPEVSRQAQEEEGAAKRQRKLRLLLRQCDRVLLMDFNLLAMSSWPDNYAVAAARRRRDLWLFSATLTCLLFLSGMSGLVPAWVAGGGFGAFVIILLAGVPYIRRLYSDRASYLELILRRQRLMREARTHIAHLEGGSGLVWQCAQMREFNPRLGASRFKKLVSLSERRVLSRYCVRREHVRLYLIYMLEAEKAYRRLEQAFFDGNQAALDAGWASAVTVPEPRA
ncbi:hypothetical protein [Marinobacter zhejiangensis]|uniref:Uncharacterized protein n=1 Tax=Marinobacter zhejiangensis TaxID=488535 RepID=A0A1I4NSV7_9GAMM|nr:hypothetical protein [Marinobacter zhejiangensis]SFM18213.1 hypothetical protein SAMN04487963_1576 [Marinobacter zhejiangensis]